VSGLSRDELAARVASDLWEGAYVNLGIGAPTRVAKFISDEVEIILHTENGMLGMGPPPAPECVDPDLVDAGKSPVTELSGASYFSQAESFAMIRGGHLDVCIMGAFQVSMQGDLANWSTGEVDAIPAVGGAMDLAVGAKVVWVMTDLLDHQDRPKLVARCSYPITAPACVTRIYSDLAIFEITSNGLFVRERFADTTTEDLRALLGIPLEELQ